MKRPVLTSLVIFFSLVLGFIFWIAASASGLQWTIAQIQKFVPFQIDTVDGRLVGPVQLAGFAFKSNGTTIHIEKLGWDWALSELLSGTFEISYFKADNIGINIIPTAEKKEQPPGEPVLPDIRIPLSIAINDLELNAISIGEETVLDTVRAKLNWRANRFNILSLELNRPDAHLALNGFVEPYGAYRHAIDTRWRYMIPDQKPLAGAGRIQGDLALIKINQRLTELVNASVNATVNDVLHDLSWQVEALTDDLELRQFAAGVPFTQLAIDLKAQGDIQTLVADANYHATGDLTGPLRGRLRLQRLQGNRFLLDEFSVRNEQNAYLNVVGDWQPSGNPGEFNLTLDWKNLAWPVTNTPLYKSEKGTLNVTGSPEQYAFTLRARAQSDIIQQANIRSQGRGDLSQIRVEYLEVAALDAIINGNADVSWKPQLDWNAQVMGSGINPEPFLPQWPGQLAFKARTKGSYSNDLLNAKFFIDELRGELRRYPVAAQAQVDVIGDEYIVHVARFRSGESRAEINGTYGKEIALSFSVRTPLLTELLPEAQGSLVARGNIQGPRLRPKVVADFTGEKIVYRDYTMDSVAGRIDVDSDNWKRLNVDLAAQSIRIEPYVINSIDVNVSGNGVRHAATVTAKTNQGDVNLALTGSVEETLWRGKLDTFGLRQTAFGDWRLKNPVDLALKQGFVSSDETCLVSGSTNVCVHVLYDKESWWLHSYARKLDLALFTPYLPNELQISGLSEFDVEGAWQTNHTPTLQGKVRFGKGFILYPVIEGERQRLDYREGRIDGKLDAEGLRAETRFDLVDAGYLQAMAELPKFNPLSFEPDSQRVTAKGELIFTDLAVVEVLVPELHEVRGQLKANFDIAGNLTDPAISGAVKLSDGGVRVPRLGLTLRELKMVADSKNGERFIYSASAKSNQGNLNIDGETVLDPEQGWPTRIAIKGKDFEVARIPEARVIVTPDLVVRTERRSIWLEGTIEIPYARLAPKDVENAVKASEDVEIVGQAPQPEEKWLIYSRVRVILGDRVSLTGFGFEGKLKGNMLLIDEPGQPTKATGELTIPEGRYLAYGQRLVIERGQILYSGSVVTNPGMNIRAVRKVADVTAGIRVRGTLRAPQFELFSIPAMSQTDALAYLVLGRPLSGASGEEGEIMTRAALALGLKGGDLLARTIGDRFGLEEMRIETTEAGDQASLVVGRYLSPRIYISYGVGLIQAINTANVRYEISKHWQLNAEVGETQGTDLIYTIEVGDYK